MLFFLSCAQFCRPGYKFLQNPPNVAQHMEMSIAYPTVLFPWTNPRFSNAFTTTYWLHHLRLAYQEPHQCECSQWCWWYVPPNEFWTGVSTKAQVSRTVRSNPNHFSKNLFWHWARNLKKRINFERQWPVSVLCDYWSTIPTIFLKSLLKAMVVSSIIKAAVGHHIKQ